MKKITTFLFCFLAINAFAQTDSVQVLEAISVNALRATNAPFVKTEITQKQISIQNTAIDLPYLLNQTAGLIATSDGGTGTGYTSLKLRGSDVTRINITLNGVPINDAESQDVFFVNFADLGSSTQNIQIQRGVGSSTNGPGAFGGSININSLDLPLQKYVQVSYDYSSFNTHKLTAKIGTGLLNKKFNINARLSKINSIGYVRNGFSNLYGGQFTAAYNLSKKANVTFNYMGGKEVTGQAWNGVPQDSLTTNRTFNDLGLKEDGTYYDDQTDNYQQHYFQLLYNQKVSKHWQFNITPYVTLGKGYYEEYKLNQNYLNYNLPPQFDKILNLIINNGSLVRQLWLNNNLVGITSTIQANYKNLGISIGLHGNQYNGKHYGIVVGTPFQTLNQKWYNLTSFKQDASAFAKVNYKATNKINVFADMQVRHVVYDINGFRERPTLVNNVNYTFFNPKAGITYTTIKDAQKTTAFASIALAHKEPNRDDLENSAANTAKPEELIDVELGYGIKGSVGSISANGYYMHYNNQLVLNGKINDVGASTRVNVPKSFRAGIEVEAIIAANKAVDFFSNLAISQNQIKNYTEYVYNADSNFNQAISYQKTNIAFSPSLIINSGINFYPSFFYTENQNVQISLIHKYVSRQYLDNTASIERAIKSYNTLDILLSYKTEQRITFRAGIRNLAAYKFESKGYTYGDIAGGKRNSYNFYYPQAGRTYTIGATLTF